MRQVQALSRRRQPTLGRVLHLVEHGAQVEPGDFVQQLLHNLRLRAGLGTPRYGSFSVSANTLHDTHAGDA
jgi:hypothetical protein